MTQDTKPDSRQMADEIRNVLEIKSQSTAQVKQPTPMVAQTKSKGAGEGRS